MYKLWPKQYPVVFEEYVRIYEDLTSDVPTHTSRTTAHHFQKLFDQYDLSLLSEDQRQECRVLITKIRYQLGITVSDKDIEECKATLQGAASVKQ